MTTPYFSSTSLPQFDYSNAGYSHLIVQLEQVCVSLLSKRQSISVCSRWGRLWLTSLICMVVCNYSHRAFLFYLLSQIMNVLDFPAISLASPDCKHGVWLYLVPCYEYINVRFLCGNKERSSGACMEHMCVFLNSYSKSVCLCLLRSCLYLSACNELGCVWLPTHTCCLTNLMEHVYILLLGLRRCVVYRSHDRSCLWLTPHMEYVFPCPAVLSEIGGSLRQAQSMS